MNEGGRVLYTGKNGAKQYTGAGVGSQFYDPKRGAAQCRVAGPTPGTTAPNPALDPRRCLLLRGSGDLVNDVIEYWFGGYVQVADDGNNPPRAVRRQRRRRPVHGAVVGLQRPGQRGNANSSSSFVSTSGILPTDRFPQFESWPSSRWNKPGGPFEPHSGSQYAYSQIADVAYKRLTRDDRGARRRREPDVLDVLRHRGALGLPHRRGPRPDGTWTTLPDRPNGHTTQDTGDSCPAATRAAGVRCTRTWTTTRRGTPHATCTPTGDTGEWHAASGNSGGWQEWTIDLDQFAGQTVQISISSITDWATHNLGVFVDDVTLPDGTSTSFESGLEGWQVTGPAEGSGPNANNWTVTDASGFPVGASITTPSSLMMGFGFEGIATTERRNEVMGRALGHLLGSG